MPLVEFEPTISAGERPKSYALDRVAAGTNIQIRRAKLFAPSFSPEDHVKSTNTENEVADICCTKSAATFNYIYNAG